MTDYLQAWQCIGCGKLEAPQTCIGVCRDRKVFMIGKDEHEAALAEIERLRMQLQQAASMLRRFDHATPRAGQWERSWWALKEEVRAALAALSAPPSA